LKGGNKMKKKNLAIFSILAIVVLGIGAVSAFGFGQGKMIGLDDEDKAEMEAFHDSLELAIESGDFVAWKNLMESQITEEHFERMQNHWSERKNNKNEIGGSFEYGEMRRGNGIHRGEMRGMGSGKMSGCPFAV